MTTSDGDEFPIRGIKVRKIGIGGKGIEPAIFMLRQNDTINAGNIGIVLQCPTNESVARSIAGLRNGLVLVLAQNGGYIRA